MLGHQQAFLLIRLRHLRARILERFHDGHATVAVLVGGAGGERLDEILRKLGFIALAAGLRRRHDHPVYSCEGLEKRPAGARRVDEHHMAGRKLVEQPDILPAERRRLRALLPILGR